MSTSASSSFIIREAIAADVSALASLHVKTFIETHGGAGPSVATREYQWKQIFENGRNDWFCLVIENQAGKLIGFAKGEVYNETELSEFGGLINKLYLLRTYHRQGLGRLLLKRVAEKFLDWQINSMLLFGDAHNQSNGFYEAMGAEKLYAKNGEFHGGYGWRDLKAINFKIL